MSSSESDHEEIVIDNNESEALKNDPDANLTAEELRAKYAKLSSINMKNEESEISSSEDSNDESDDDSEEESDEDFSEDDVETKKEFDELQNDPDANLTAEQLRAKYANPTATTTSSTTTTSTTTINKEDEIKKHKKRIIDSSSDDDDDDDDDEEQEAILKQHKNTASNKKSKSIIVSDDDEDEDEEEKTTEANQNEITKKSKSIIISDDDDESEDFSENEEETKKEFEELQNDPDANLTAEELKAKYSNITNNDEENDKIDNMDISEEEEKNIPQSIITTTTNTNDKEEKDISTIENDQIKKEESDSDDFVDEKHMHGKLSKALSVIMHGYGGQYDGITFKHVRKEALRNNFGFKKDTIKEYKTFCLNYITLMMKEADMKNKKKRKKRSITNNDDE